MLPVRLNRIAVRMTDDHARFLSALAEKDHRPPASQAYALLCEAFDDLGFKEWLAADKLTIATKNRL